MKSVGKNQVMEVKLRNTIGESLPINIHGKLNRGRRMVNYNNITQHTNLAEMFPTGISHVTKINTTLDTHITGKTSQDEAITKNVTSDGIYVTSTIAYNYIMEYVFHENDTNI